MDLKGSITALITPFRNGAVDEQGFRELIEWQIAEGTNGIVPVGTTGESPTLSADEHKRVIEIAVETAAGRVPVIAGTGSNSTAEAIEFTRHAAHAGADAALVVVPYYNKPTQEGLYSHFRAMAAAADIPIIVYNVPGRTVASISVETLDRLAQRLAAHHRHQGCHRRPHPRVAPAPDDRRGVHPALGRGCHRPRLQRPWRRRLHLGDRQCRAAALRRVPATPAATAITRPR